MIRITQVKLPITHTYEDLLIRTAKLLRISDSQIKNLRIVKQSVDARKREEVSYSYVLDVETDREEQVVKRCKNPNASISKEKPYRFPEHGEEVLAHPPVIVGSGPAGLFCGLMLARHGYKPILLERGGSVEERTKAVQEFWKTGKLDKNCNVQFGEGGAGTFSDGKLNTLVKDPIGRNRLALQLFTEFGADPSICYLNKPHIGTDVLSGIVAAMREEIIRLGGEVWFHSQVTDIRIEGGRVKGVTVQQTTAGNQTRTLPADALILAIGHSARDTFEMLKGHRIPMEAKAFAVGLRIQHPQEMIDESQYGSEAAGILGPASYKLTHQCQNGRGVYSFCMCPGGFVVNASSEEGRLAVNGMSYHARDGKNANSALIVTVTPEDFASDPAGQDSEDFAGDMAGQNPKNFDGSPAGHTSDPLAGIAFQRRLEAAAFRAGGGKIPVQLYGDFKNHSVSTAFGQVEPQFEGETAFADLRSILPEELSQSLIEGVERFGGVIKGFNRKDAIFAGIESRTSSPVRINRDEHFESAVNGLFPCGEGAGYAGGITSAAMDGIRIAEEVARRYRPLA